METKDIILLLTIPIVLMIILFSLGKIPTITGAATADEANPKLGEYSIMPSFKAKIDYNINEEYGKLKTRLKQIIDECKADENMEECVSKKTGEDYEIQWKCGEKDTDVLYDFVDKLKDCINLQQENAMCQFSFDKREYINKVKSQRTFEIKITNWYPPMAKAELFEDGKWLAMEYVDLGRLAYSDDIKNPAKNANSITMKVLFDEGTPIVQDFYASTDSSPRVELSRLFLLHKPQKNEADAADAVSAQFIDAAVESNFRTPPKNVINLPNIKGMKFCAKTGKQILAYDSIDNGVRMRDIEYKFAITFPKAAPKPLESLEAPDALKAENSIILVWNKPKEEVDSYSIYYSNNDFSGKKISDIKKDEYVKKITIDAANPARIENIDLTQCSFDSIGSPCKYDIYKNPLQPGRLYYWKSKDRIIYLANGLADGQEYYFAVTAANSQGELSNDRTISGNTYVLSEGKNYIKSAPADDLAPGKVTELDKAKTPEGKIKITWKRPSKNIDGSEANDVLGYKIYYKKSTADINPQLEPGHGVKQITAADAKCAIVSLYCDYIIENIAGLEKGQNYNFAVVPIDENGNEYNLESERIPVQIE
ncbi:hypothetical protein HYX06_05770 [Candidatus Woesearchaeota archaeon]|nr:hypothetical protein [Candidatus Woesearchaeota archaeon]